MIKQVISGIKSSLFSKEAFLDIIMLSIAIAIAGVGSAYNSFALSNNGLFSLPLVAIAINIMVIMAFFLSFGLRLNEAKEFSFSRQQIPINLGAILVFTAIFIPIEGGMSNWSPLLSLSILPLIIILFVFIQLRIERLIEDATTASYLGYTLNVVFIILCCIPLLATLVVYGFPEVNVSSTESGKLHIMSKEILTESFNYVWEYF